NEPNPWMLSGGKLQSYRKSDNFQLMLNKRPAAGLIVSADRRMGKFKAAFDQEACPAVCERIDHGGGACRWIVVELRFRSIDEPEWKRRHSRSFVRSSERPTRAAM